MCGPSVESNACAKCEDENCCDSYAACHNDSTCGDLLTCLKACATTDTACSNKCYEASTTVPSGELAARLTCLEYKCPTQCGITLGACIKCVQTNCQDADLACATNGDCWRIGECEGPCGKDSKCFAACEQKFPGGVSLNHDYLACSLAHCAAECGM
jgi:hypothetical protein